MFNLTLYDHLQLTFSQIVERHKFHTRTARSHGRWNRRLRGAEALFIGGVSIAAVGAAFGHGQMYGQVLAIVAASLGGLALLVLLAHLTFDFDTSSHSHAACGARLWEMRERYRSLLSDLHDGVIDLGSARMRRDALLDELRAIYETTTQIAPLDDQPPAPESAPMPLSASPVSAERAH